MSHCAAWPLAALILHFLSPSKSFCMGSVTLAFVAAFTQKVEES